MAISCGDGWVPFGGAEDIEGGGAEVMAIVPAPSLRTVMGLLGDEATEIEILVLMKHRCGLGWAKLK